MSENSNFFSKYINPLWKKGPKKGSLDYFIKHYLPIDNEKYELLINNGLDGYKLVSRGPSVAIIYGNSDVVLATFAEDTKSESINSINNLQLTTGGKKYRRNKTNKKSRKNRKTRRR